ncbi:MAG: HAD family hydrolase, partial [Syntrophomonadaceae bacterium]|nr:HAD family hydrolase [Syntrophomonadaceae bacterium]
MIQVSIPGKPDLELHHLLLDMNGTLTVDGVLLDGIRERLEFLKPKLNVYMLTADTFGTGAQVAEELGIELFAVGAVNGGEDKQDFVAGLEPPGVVVIGNGVNDVLMMAAADLAIAVLGREGCALAALREADVAVRDVNDALDLLI